MCEEHRRWRQQIRRGMGTLMFVPGSIYKEHSEELKEHFPPKSESKVAR